MSQGWISVHRQLQEHWLWEEKPFSKGQAWIDILLMANHADKKFLFGNELIEVKAGCFITSERKLAERWGWSRKKVDNFLMLLQKDEMLVTKKNHQRTMINIVNYSDFQEDNIKKEPAKNQRRTMKEPAKNTNNNDNNVNNDNKLFIYSENPDLDKAIIEFVDFRKKLKKPMTDHAVELMITKLNKLSPDVNTQIEIINQSIMRGWTGVFPLKEDEVQKPKPTKTKNMNNFNRRQYDMDAMERMLTNQYDPPKTAGTDEEVRRKAEELQKRLGVI